MASLYKRASIYYVAYLQDGKRVYKSTGKKTKPEALRFLVEHEKSLSGRKFGTISTFLQDFLTFSKNNHAPRTHPLYVRCTKLFVSFIGDKYIHLVKPLDVERYKNHRLESVKPTTVNIELRTIKAMFGYAVKWGLLEKSPCRNVQQVRIPEQTPIYLTQDQVRTLLGAIDNPPFMELVEFAIHTGMRRGEILNLKWESVDLSNRMIAVKNSPTFRTKSGRVHRVPMNEVVYHMLAQKGRTSEYVFAKADGRRFEADFVSHKFKKYVRRARLPESIHFHSLRHTFGSLLAQAGVPIFDIQKLLNHRSISTTQIYSHLSPEHLRASVERLVTTKN